MKKSTFWIIVLVIIVLVGIIYYARVHSVTVQPTQPTTSQTSTTTPATDVAYYCTEGTLTASYGTDSVTLTLPDGTTETLPQIVSASGARYGSGTVVFWNEGSDAFMQNNGVNTYTNCVAGTQASSANGMSTYTDPTKLFSLSYPTTFTLAGGEQGYTQDWRAEAPANELGLQLVTVTIPQSFQPNTNFGDAKFTVGTSSDPTAVKNCLIDDSGYNSPTSTVDINGTTFTKMGWTDAGAGNLYATTSYRTVLNNQCYAVEYTIHSGNIDNYPPNSGITAFSQTQVTTALESIVQSFKFLPQ